MLRNYLLVLVASGLLLFGTSVLAQTSPSQQSHSPDQMAHELHELKMKVMKLEMSLQQPPTPGSKSPKNAPMLGQGGAMPKGQGMGAMGEHMQQMMGMMQMMHGPMGSSPGTSGMSLPSSLPGFPGASHIYHIGATGFFVDQAGLIGLTAEQQTNLNKIKEKALIEQENSDRRAANLEQELWQLTASDKPELSKIEAKVREIEKIKGNKRISFIASVGEATQLLTPQQMQILVGQAAPVTSGNGNQQPMPGMGGAQGGQGSAGMGMGHM